jgi:hypothetical protein
MSKFILITASAIICGLACVQYHQDRPCGLCLSPAFKITMVDSAGMKLGGFTIRAINTHGDTLIENDTSSDYTWARDSSYLLYGISGIYSLEMTNLQYETIILDSVSVSEGRCGINPKLLKIIPQEKKLAKRKVTAYTIVLDSNAVGCGN